MLLKLWQVGAGGWTPRSRLNQRPGARIQAERTHCLSQLVLPSPPSVYEDCLTKAFSPL